MPAVATFDVAADRSTLLPALYRAIPVAHDTIKRMLQHLQHALAGTQVVQCSVALALTQPHLVAKVCAGLHSAPACMERALNQERPQRGCACQPRCEAALVYAACEACAASSLVRRLKYFQCTVRLRCRHCAGRRSGHWRRHGQVLDLGIHYHWPGTGCNQHHLGLPTAAQEAWSRLWVRPAQLAAASQWVLVLLYPHPLHRAATVTSSWQERLSPRPPSRRVHPRRRRQLRLRTQTRTRQRAQQQAPAARLQWGAHSNHDGPSRLYARGAVRRALCCVWVTMALRQLPAGPALARGRARGRRAGCGRLLECCGLFGRGGQQRGTECQRCTAEARGASSSARGDGGPTIRGAGAGVPKPRGAAAAVVSTGKASRLKGSPWIT